MRYVILFLAAALLASCSTPKQPCAMPGVEAAANGGGAAAAAGQRSKSAPETGTQRGVANPTSSYVRGNADIRSDYSPESRQAGAITNPKQWTGSADATAFASSSPTCVRAAARLLDLIGIQASSVEPGSDQWNSLMDRANSILEFQAKEGADYRKEIIKLAPRFERCVMVNLDLSGSSTGGQDAVDPKNGELAAKGVPAAIKEAGKIVDGDLEGSSSKAKAAAQPPPKPEAGAVDSSGELPDAPAGSAEDGGGR